MLVFTERRKTLRQGPTDWYEAKNAATVRLLRNLTARRSIRSHAL